MNKRDREIYRAEYRKHFDKARSDYLMKKAKKKALDDAERGSFIDRILGFIGSIIGRFEEKKEKRNQEKVKY